MRVRIHPTGEERWRVPITIDGTGTAAKNPLYDVQFTYKPVFSFKVKSTLCPMSMLNTSSSYIKPTPLKVVRKSSGAVLFDSSLGGLTLADQFLQVRFFINSNPSRWDFPFKVHQGGISPQSLPNFSDWSPFAPKQQRLWIWRAGTAQLQT